MILQTFNDIADLQRYCRQLATMKYSTFPCAEHSNEPPKTEIVGASGLHDFLSFISIAQKETLHISLWQAAHYYKNIVSAPE